MKRPLAAIGVSMLASAVFILFGGERVYIPLFAVLIAACICCFLLKKYRLAKYLFAVMFSLTAVFLPLHHETECRFLPQKQLENSCCRIEGKAADFCEAYTAENNSVTLKRCSVNGQKVNADIFVSFPQSFSCGYGDTVSAEVFIYQSSYSSPADCPDGIFLTAKAVGDTAVTPAKHHSFIYAAKLARIKLARLIEMNMPEEEAGVAKALLLGDKACLSAEYLSALKIAGASHIFAVSGMHLSLWSGILFLILRNRSRAKAVPNIAVSVFILFYMALTGFSPSVMRAGIMLLTVLAGACFRRPADPLNSLGLSAAVLLLIEPLTAVNVSFLLSFNATASMFVVYPYLERAVPRRRKRFTPSVKRRLTVLLNDVLLSLCVLLFTSPISGEYFGTVSLLSPVSSILCTLPAEAVMLLTASALGVLKIPFLSRALFALDSFHARYVIRTVTRLSAFDFAVCEVRPAALLAWYAVTGAVCAAVYFGCGRKAVKTLTALLVCTGLIIPGALIRNTVTAKRTYMFIPSCGTAGAVLVYTDLGGTAALIYNREDEDSIYAVYRYMLRHNIPDIDILIVPAPNKDNLSAIRTAEEYLNITDTAQAESGSFSPGDFCCDIGSRIRYENVSDPSLGLGALRCGETKTVFCFYAGAELDGIPSSALSGDILICRSKIPKAINTDDFDRIIVLSDKMSAAGTLPVNAVSTAETDGITVSIGAKEEYNVFY